MSCRLASCLLEWCSPASHHLCLLRLQGGLACGVAGSQGVKAHIQGVAWEEESPHLHQRVELLGTGPSPSCEIKLMGECLVTESHNLSGPEVEPVLVSTTILLGQVMGKVQMTFADCSLEDLLPGSCALRKRLEQEGGRQALGMTRKCCLSCWRLLQVCVLTLLVTGLWASALSYI